MSVWLGRTRSGVAVALITLIALLAVACGSESSPEADNTSGSQSTGEGVSLASAVKIDDAVDARVGTEDFTTIGDPVEVTVGDIVRTDSSGFAAVEYFDGSLTRLDVDTEFTVIALSNEPTGSEVRTRMGLGRTWHRVEQLGTDDTYVVETSVATATVRGTAFVVTCTVDGCTFDVLEGTIEITVTTSGEVLTLEAGQSLTVSVDGIATSGTVDPTVVDDVWLARNFTLDTEIGFNPLDLATTEPPVGDAGSDLDPAAVDPCLMSSSEILSVIALNQEALGGFYSNGTWGPGVFSDFGLPSCDYEVQFDDDGGAGPSIFSVVVVGGSSPPCFVVHRGVCIAPRTTYATDEVTLDVPDDLAASLRERIDAQ